MLFNKYEDYSFATKIFRIHFCRKPASFLSNRFCPSVFCACFYCTSSYCAPDLIFILPARRKTFSLLSAMSPTGNLDTTLSCLRQKKRAQNLKKNLLHFFALIFVQKISFSPPSEDRCLALQVKPRLRAGAFTRAKKFILFSSARQAKSFLFNFYAPRYCSADLDYARSRFGISNSLSVFTTNVLLPGESFLLASGFCSNFPRRCVSRRFFILNAAYFLS